MRWSLSTPSPQVFNKTFCYDVPLTELNTVKLVLKIVYSDRYTRNCIKV